MKIVVRNGFAKFFTPIYVKKISRLMRVHYGWRCVYDVVSASAPNLAKKPVSLQLVNRFDSLKLEDEGEYDKTIKTVEIDTKYDVASCNKNAPNSKQRGLRIGTWNFQGLCSDRKALEVGEVLSKNHIDILGGQESWEVDSSEISVPGYKWVGRPRLGTKGKRGEGGVGFLVSEPLLDDATIIKNVKCSDTIWLKIKIRNSVDLFIGCVYMPTQGSLKQLCIDRYNLLEEDICLFQSKGRVLLLGDFNARVGRSCDVDDVIGMFEETTSNSNSNLLISLLQKCNLMICNGRTLLSDPQWTRVQNRLNQKSIIDYIITDKALLKASSDVFVDKTDIGSSDHYAVWFELGNNFTKCRNKTKRALYKCRVDRLQDKTVRSEYQAELGLHAQDFFNTLN